MFLNHEPKREKNAEGMLSAVFKIAVLCIVF